MKRKSFLHLHKLQIAKKLHQDGICFEKKLDFVLFLTEHKCLVLFFQEISLHAIYDLFQSFMPHHLVILDVLQGKPCSITTVCRMVDNAIRNVSLNANQKQSLQYFSNEQEQILFFSFSESLKNATLKLVEERILHGLRDDKTENAKHVCAIQSKFCSGRAVFSKGKQYVCKDCLYFNFHKLKNRNFRQLMAWF